MIASRNVGSHSSISCLLYTHSLSAASTSNPDPTLKSDPNGRLFPRRSEWPPVQERGEKLQIASTLPGFSSTTGAFLFSPVGSGGAPRSSQTTHLNPARPRSRHLSQQQHPPLGRRQTSGGQTLLPCDSPRCFSLPLWMPSLLSPALPRATPLVRLSLSHVHRGVPQSPNIIHPACDGLKKRPWVAINISTAVVCGTCSPRSDLLHSTSVYAVSYKDSSTGSGLKLKAVCHICSAARSSSFIWPLFKTQVWIRQKFQQQKLIWPAHSLFYAFVVTLWGKECQNKVI